MKNKKAQTTIFVGIMVAITVFIMVINFIPVLKPLITQTRDSDHLDCANASISTATKMTCIIVDIWLFYFVGVTMALGFGFITGKGLIG